MFCTPFHLVEFPPPGLSIPDLEVVGDTGDHDVARETGVLEESARDHDPALLVELRLAGAREEMALELAAVGLERIERADASLEALAPVAGRVRIEAPVHASRDDDAGGQLLAKLRRQREPVLVVDGVFVFAEEHDRAITGLPLSTTLDHYSPLRNPRPTHLSRPRLFGSPRAADPCPRPGHRRCRVLRREVERVRG